ncbi:FGGY-family carbohydrate kinase [bacterium]|nr:FGGY-family carbohydrate kinase [bacterium]MBU1064706.1 FGGY-family carbohydrate kinase [bacterium]MBU1635230.1 FGGY-family carbohydrate kinase [bacterium]MBU1875472.1 FGGY-family carbohydrate kinase [bacterium]
METKYILSHDMGTSSNKAMLVTVFGDVVDTAKVEYPMEMPAPGFAEQDPQDWWNAICETSKELVRKTSVNLEDIVGVTFSSQMQGLVCVSREGKPLRKAISWVDSRAGDIMRKKIWTAPRVQGYNIFRLIKFLRITGGTPSLAGKDIIGKILWLKEHEPDLIEKTYKYLDPKDYIVYKMTGKYVKSTDLAVVWWLLDTRKNRNQWDPKLCKMTGIEMEKLPEVKASGEIAGKLTEEAAEAVGLLPGTPIMNGAGDISAAALGSGAVEDGRMHIRIGTSGGIAGHFVKRKIDLAHYAGCIGSAYPEKYYLGLAAQDTMGICLEWIKNKVIYHAKDLKDEYHVDKIYQILDKLVERIKPGADGVIFTPWMYGERCPLNDDTLRGGIYNLGLNHTRDHIIRAVFEGISMNIRWALEVMEKMFGHVNELNFVGGGAMSDTWCQIMADITNRTIHQVTDPQQAAGKGVALLASISLGYIESFEEIGKYIKIKSSYYPNPDNRAIYDKHFKAFKKLYKLNRKWHAMMNSDTKSH